jgi:hypothetical protein
LSMPSTTSSTVNVTRAIKPSAVRKASKFIQASAIARRDGRR